MKRRVGLSIGMSCRAGSFDLKCAFHIQKLLLAEKARGSFFPPPGALQLDKARSTANAVAGGPVRRTYLASRMFEFLSNARGHTFRFVFFTVFADKRQRALLPAASSLKWFELPRDLLPPEREDSTGPDRLSGKAC